MHQLNSESVVAAHLAKIPRSPIRTKLHRPVPGCFFHMGKSIKDLQKNSSCASIHFRWYGTPVEDLRIVSKKCEHLAKQVRVCSIPFGISSRISYVAWPSSNCNTMKRSGSRNLHAFAFFSKSSGCTGKLIIDARGGDVRGVASSRRRSCQNRP